MTKPIGDSPATEKPILLWSLYLIECKNGSIYTGITNNVAARYDAHVLGKGAKYTRANPPKRLLTSVVCGDRSAASKAEYAMKQLSAHQKKAFCKQQNKERRI